MNKITKLSTVALALMLCVGCSANKDNQKTKTEQPKQENVTANPKEDKATAAKRMKLTKELEKYNKGTESFISNKQYQKYIKTPIKEYGQKVEVKGKKMNVYTVGEGKVPIVFIPGQGTVTAKHQYHNLISNLSKTHKVVVVEPFGSGLSDVIDQPRNLANITSDIHEALQKVGITGKYVIASHSIGGVYALKYISTYPKEVLGLIGLDTSTPGMEGGKQVDFAAPVLKELPKIPKVSDDINAQFFAIGHKILNNSNMKEEAKNSSNMINESANYKIPKGIPAMYLLARESDLGLQLRSLDIPIKGSWQEQHKELSEDPKEVSIHTLDGTHQIYDTNLKEVIDYTNQFMKTFEK
ncbi:TPA: alpha/beta hydrolase [Streptococcus agalactiae]|nr:alpha/beta hydrolase [Streptococcus agalactiae]